MFIYKRVVNTEAVGGGGGGWRSRGGPGVGSGVGSGGGRVVVLVLHIFGRKWFRVDRLRVGTQDKKMSKGHLPRVVHHQAHSVYSDCSFSISVKQSFSAPRLCGLCAS